MFFLRCLNNQYRAFLLAVFVLFGTFAPIAYAYASDIIFASWNIQHLGHGDHKKYTGLAAIAAKFDLLEIGRAHV